MSLTAQIVDRFRQGIDGGELAPGEKLPTTRALAEAAGVNHLTAVRAYRRLSERGYVTAAVGRGTFVRRLPPLGAARRSHGSEWQSAVLPDVRPSYANEILAESFRMPADPGMTSLATGWPDPRLYPVRELAEHSAAVFEELGGEALSYVDPEGVAALRAELAKRGRTAGFASSPDEIIVTSGARQGLDLVCRAVVSPGDVVAVESPTFTGLLSSLQATGARVIGIPVDDDGADIEALGAILARHDVKLVALQTASQNPTGRDLAESRRERLVELARERSFFVLEDGVHATVRFAGPALARLRARAAEHVICVDSLSKTVGGGLRLGWLAASGPIHARAWWRSSWPPTCTRRASSSMWSAATWVRVIAAEARCLAAGPRGTGSPSELGGVLARVDGQIVDRHLTTVTLSCDPPHPLRSTGGGTAVDDPRTARAAGQAGTVITKSSASAVAVRRRRSTWRPSTPGGRRSSRR